MGLGFSVVAARRQVWMDFGARSPCSWVGFPGFWFVSGPAQGKYTGPVWVGLHGLPSG